MDRNPRKRPPRDRPSTWAGTTLVFLTLLVAVLSFFAAWFEFLSDANLATCLLLAITCLGAFVTTTMSRYDLAAGCYVGAALAWVQIGNHDWPSLAAGLTITLGLMMGCAQVSANQRSS